MSKNNYVVDAPAGTARLELYVADELAAFYTFADGDFTLSARPDATMVPLAELIVNVEDIRDWFRRCVKELGLTPAPFPRYDEKFEEDASGVNMRLKFGPATITQAAFDRISQEATFQPRPEIIIPPHRFERFLKTLERFVVEAIG